MSEVTESVIGWCFSRAYNFRMWEGSLTDGDAAVGAAEVDVALRDGGHAQLVEGPAEERGKCAGKHNVTVPHGATYRHTHLSKIITIIIIININKNNE